jgi:hypothetical protein
MKKKTMDDDDEKEGWDTHTATGQHTTTTHENQSTQPTRTNERTNENDTNLEGANQLWIALIREQILQRNGGGGGDSK